MDHWSGYLDCLQPFQDAICYFLQNTFLMEFDEVTLYFTGPKCVVAPSCCSSLIWKIMCARRGFDQFSCMFNFHSCQSCFRNTRNMPPPSQESRTVITHIFSGKFHALFTEHHGGATKTEGSDHFYLVNNSLHYHKGKQQYEHQWCKIAAFRSDRYYYVHFQNIPWAVMIQSLMPWLMLGYTGCSL